MLTAECHVLLNKCERNSGLDNQHFVIIEVNIGLGKVYEQMLKSRGQT